MIKIAKILKYSKLKKRQYCLETYEPKTRIKINKENTLPWVIRFGNRLFVLGGLMGLWAGSLLLMIKGIFGVEEKFRKFSLNNRVVEIKIKNK